MPNRVAILIDGAYLEYVLKEHFGRPRIDFAALSNELAAGADILRSYYYHCSAYQGNPPTEEERKRYSAQRRFFEALERLPRYSVRLGRLARRGPDDQGKYRFEQNFIPAISVAKSEGVLVRLFPGPDPHDDLWQEADERVSITQELIDSVRR